MEQNEYTKESIRARMLSRTSSLWNTRNVDNLDPVVKVLVEALASEIFKLSGDLEEIEGRIVEKLARTFTPSFMMSASPAHAIIHTRAASGSYEVKTGTEFLYKEPRFIQKYNLTKLTFTPVRNTKIIDGDVAAIIAREKFYHVTPQGGKDHAANAMHRDPLFNSTMWVGLDTGSAVHDLHDLSFYFELPPMEDSAAYFRLLGHTRFSTGGSDIATAPGMPQQDEDMRLGLFDLFDPRRQMNEDIIDKYRDQYISIAGALKTINLKKETFPAEISHLFGKDFTGGLRKELIWIKITFPPAFDDNAISHLCIHLNCFPVANMFNHTVVRGVSPLSSIVPLEKDNKEFFLHIDSVTDSRNREYKQVRSHEDNADIGTYMIRRGGCERFNSVNAKDYLERLMDLYRDETTAFSNMDRDVAGTVEELLALLSELGLKIRSYDRDIEQTSYLIFGTDVSEKHNITVCYSLSNGAVANGVVPCEVLSVPDDSDIEPHSVLFMTATRGGRRSPSESSNKDIYQYLLTSRDRIYTKEDIRLFCKCYFGEHFTEVKIESGYEVSKLPNEGIIRTTNIILRGTGTSPGIMTPEMLTRDMLAGLARRSPEGMNYRIILK